MAKRYAIAIDERRCIGCWSCAVACKLENNIPDQIWYAHVETIGGDSPNTPAGTYGDCTMSYRPVRCMHCDDAPCVEVCPVGATYKDDETGIVMQDVETCIGCQACIAACPYDVRSYLEEEPAYRVDFPVGAVNAPTHKAGTVEKCTMCAHRDLAGGAVPACVEGCPARAMHFGDLNDPASEISKLLAERTYEVLKPEAGTGPNVYYLQ